MGSLQGRYDTPINQSTIYLARVQEPVIGGAGAGPGRWREREPRLGFAAQLTRQQAVRREVEHVVVAERLAAKVSLARRGPQQDRSGIGVEARAHAAPVKVGFPTPRKGRGAGFASARASRKSTKARGEGTSLTAMRRISQAADA